MKKYWLFAILVSFSFVVHADENEEYASKIEKVFDAQAKDFYNSYNDLSPNPLAKSVSYFAKVPVETMKSIVEIINDAVHYVPGINNEASYEAFADFVIKATEALKGSDLNGAHVNQVTRGLTDFLVLYYLKYDMNFNDFGWRYIAQVRKEMKIDKFSKESWKVVLDRNVTTAKN